MPDPAKLRRPRTVGSAFPGHRTTLLGVLCVLLGLALSGCTSQPKPIDIETLGPPPSYSELAAAYNRRVQPMETLWARATVQVVQQTARGRETRDQGEGFLQLQRPRRLALQLGKLGETFFYLGSNDELYWWFDMLDRDNRRATIGRHDEASPEVIEAFGVPLHPLDLLEVLPVTPMPAEGGTVAWRADGRALRVRLPARSGEKLLDLDPTTLDLLGAAIRSRNGELLLTAETQGTRSVSLPTGLPGPMIPSRYVIDLPRAEAQVRLNIWDPEIRPLADLPFDPLELLERYRIPAWAVTVVGPERSEGAGE
ncbi:MAG: hypothetical protein EA378_09955 [Phycisphaerales bacterium]|nr:MAG: hypothetical protein EA378_09955 [Phycisphaerales bacterium]